MFYTNTCSLSTRGCWGAGEGSWRTRSQAFPSSTCAAWLHSLATRLADTSLAVYEALLELEGADARAGEGRRGRSR